MIGFVLRENLYFRDYFMRLFCLLFDLYHPDVGGPSEEKSGNVVVSAKWQLCIYCKLCHA